ncbi:MAG TPA: hypothetical protein VF614_15700, partial [Chthoniobacteraceae bacterium]
MSTVSYTEVAAAVLDHPKVQKGFLQHQVTLHHDRKIPVSGSPGAWHHTDRYSEHFRVVLWSDDDFAETAGELLPAVRE